MIRVLNVFLIFLWLVSTNAMAQAPKGAPKGTVPAQAAVPSTPERTTASFGDWVLRCEAAVPPARRFCEVGQVMTLQGQTSPTAQVALGRQAPNESVRLTIVVPTNIDILSKPQVSITKAGAAPIDLTWQRCAPGACFASAPVTDETVGTLGMQTEAGRILFKDAADHEVALPLSFRGLAQALAALAKEQ